MKTYTCAHIWFAERAHTISRDALEDVVIEYFLGGMTCEQANCDPIVKQWMTDDDAVCGEEEHND